MKISISESFKLAKEKLPSNVSVDLCFFTDAEMNDRIIYAIATEAGSSKTALWLSQFGMAFSFEEGRRMVEKALKAVDSSAKL